MKGSCLLWVLAIGVAPASADDALLGCVQIEDGPERLACFDAVMRERVANPPADAQASAASAPRGVAPEPPLPKRESIFARTRVEALLVDHRRDALGRWIFVLDNGQVWQQTDSYGRLRVLQNREPSVVVQERLMGGYTLKLAGNRGVQARRVK